MTRRRCWSAVAPATATLLTFVGLVACGDDAATTGGAGAGGAGGSTSSQGTGGEGTCVQGDTEACYDGPTATRNVGVCRDGVRTCGLAGFGPCGEQVLPAVTDDCGQPGDEDCDGIACSELVWGLSYDTTGTSNGHAIAFRPGGSVIVGAALDGDIYFDVDGWVGFGNPYLVLVEILPNGTTGWNDVDIFGTEPSAFDLVVAANGTITYAGGFRGTMGVGGGLVSQGEEDVFVVRRDATGIETWAAHAGDASPSQRATRVAVDASGDVIVAGRFTGTLDFGGGATVSHGATDLDVFVAKLDGGTGIGVWAVSYGDPALDDPAPALAVGDTGEVLLAGGFQGTIAPGGATPLSSATDLDVYVAKLDAQGAAVWAQGFAGTGDQVASAVAVDPNGNVFIAGSMSGTLDLGGILTVPDATMDAFVGKLTTAGAPVVGKRFDDTGDTLAIAGAIDADGSFSITGQLTDSVDLGGGVVTRPDGSPTSFVAKFDNTLTHRWSKAFSVQGLFSSTAIAVDRTGVGNVAVTGGLDGTVDFGGGSVTSHTNALLEVAAVLFRP